jgi:Na+(H+)/acetate symporter ActP
MGGFAASIALQIAVSQTGYKTPIYSQFFFIGLMAIAFLVIPETPCR